MCAAYMVMVSLLFKKYVRHKVARWFIILNFACVHNNFVYCMLYGNCVRNTFYHTWQIPVYYVR